VGAYDGPAGVALDEAAMPKKPVRREERASPSMVSRYLRDMGKLRPTDGISPGGTLDLVEANLSFVVKVAQQYRTCGLPLEDLLNEGNLGLIEAARRFDRDKGVKFITYAVYWIRKAILKAIAEQVTIVRLPSSQARRIRDIEKAKQALSPRLGRAPNRTEISEHLETKPEKVERALQYNVHGVSLDQPLPRLDTGTLADSLSDSDQTCAEEQLLEREVTLLLLEAVQELNEQQSRVLTRRFGLDGNPPQTLEEIGTAIGLSRERVRQIEVGAKNRLKRRLAHELTAVRGRRDASAATDPPSTRTPSPPDPATQAPRGRGKRRS